MQNKTYLLRPRPPLLLVTTNRLSFKRFRIDATAQRAKKLKGEGSQPNTETNEQTKKTKPKTKPPQGSRARERKTIQTIESIPGSTALPNLSLLQEEISQQASVLRSPRARTRGTLCCLPAALLQSHLILVGSRNPAAERTTSLQSLPCHRAQLQGKACPQACADLPPQAQLPASVKTGRPWCPPSHKVLLISCLKPKAREWGEHLVFILSRLNGKHFLFIFHSEVLTPSNWRRYRTSHLKSNLSATKADSAPDVSNLVSYRQEPSLFLRPALHCSAWPKNTPPPPSTAL